MPHNSYDINQWKIIYQRNSSYLQKEIYQKMKFKALKCAWLLDHKAKVEQIWSCRLSLKPLKHQLKNNSKSEELFFSIHDYQ